jgi:WD40 repeat protein
LTPFQFSPDGRTLFVSAPTVPFRASWQLWDLASRRRKIGALPDVIGISRDGALIAGSTWKGYVRLWDATSLREVAPLKSPGQAPVGELWANSLLSVAFSPDGKTVATAGAQRTVWLWDLRSRREIAPALRGFQDAICTIAFSPDGSILAVADYAGAVRVYDTTAWNQIGEPIQAHTGEAIPVMFSPDSKTLATGGEDGTVKLWNTRTWRMTLSLKAHTKMINSVVFSPDGSLLITAGNDGTVRLWHAPSFAETDVPARVVAGTESG